MLIEAIEKKRQSSIASTHTKPSALTILAHDLRGPLTSLRLLVEMIGTQGNGLATAKISDYSCRAEQIIDRLDGLLNSTLERVRDAGDPLSLKLETFDLIDVLSEAIKTILPQARAKSVSLIAIPQGPVKYCGDRELLLQVVENLVGNAVKYSRPYQYVNCAVKRVEEHVHVSVKDNGAGMTEKDLNRVFGPFTALSAKSPTHTPSWGLGLWIAKLIIEQHRGTIYARSDGFGHGSQFGFVLPLTASARCRKFNTDDCSNS